MIGIGIIELLVLMISMLGCDSPTDRGLGHAQKLTGH